MPDGGGGTTPRSCRLPFCARTRTLAGLRGWPGLAGAGGGGVEVVASSGGAEDLTWAPAWRLRELIGRREVSPVEVVEDLLGRAAELEGTVRCWQEPDADGARAAAKEAERAVLDGRDLGPLHGVPVGIKSNI